jgi:DNA-binding NarL/FixJ family response regulator
LRDTPDLVLAGAARDVRAGLTLAALVDVLLCDLQLGGEIGGLDVVRAVHDPARPAFATPPAVIVLTSFEHASLIRASIDAGAVGFLHKSAEMDVIVAAIRTVAAGGSVFSADAIRRARSAPRRPSDRELQVIDLVVAGASNGEIAARLSISEKTVESHLRRLFDRYGLLSRTELAVLARDEGWTGGSGHAPMQQA